METTFHVQWRRQRCRALVYLYVTFLLSGVLFGLLWRSSDADAFLWARLLSAIAISLGFMWYCTADARLLGKPLLPMARVGIFIFWLAGVPIYLFWARQFKGLGLLLLHGLLLFLTYLISAMAVAYLAYGDKLLG
jgi:hypothetical protein